MGQFTGMAKLKPSFKINNRRLSLDNLPEEIDPSWSGSWNLSVINSIKEWYNDNGYVTMYTSGSTGKPKAIQLSKQDIKASVQLTLSTFKLNRKDKILCCLPLSYIAGRMMLYRGLIGRLDIILVEPKINPIAELIEPIKFMALTPMQIEAILDQTPEKFDLVDIILIGGAPISNNLERKILDRVKSQVFESYGMTETITHVAIREIDRQDYFEALAGVRFSIHADDCLSIHTNHLSQTKFDTNDVVHLLSESKFRWQGRRDRIINVGGIKVSPEQLETKISALLAMPYFVINLPDDTAGEQIALVIEDKQWGEQRILTALDEVSAVCSKYERPRTIFFSSKFVRTHTGKVDRLKTMTQIQGL